MNNNKIIYLNSSKIKEYKDACFQSKVCISIINNYEKFKNISAKELKILNQVRYSEVY
jgi:hypothetical protein